jgi:thiol-disulfide isomerase/thioredoxin
LLTLTFGSLTANAVVAGPEAGLWQATAEVSGARIPFQLEIAGEGSSVHAHFFDGSRPTNPSGAGELRDGHLHLTFPSYAAVLDAKLAGERLEGTYTAGTNHPITIHATRGGPPVARAAAAPRIAGEWIIPFRSPKGESAWRLIVRQTGGSAQAAILRIDGDTGTLNGRFANGHFELSHFAGERPALLEATPSPDGSLKLVLVDGSGRRELSAVRPSIAAAEGVAPTDPTRHTSVSDGAQPFAFAFKDLSGRPVSNTDPKFRHKVVLVNIMGSWCPNCHDEAPFLQSLYARHHAQGLEIVALDFEQRPEQLVDPARLRAFIQRYGISYTVLLAGETKDVNAKVPQAVNLNAWPTTFFLGRDGRVKSVHVGFTSPGSGPRDAETRAGIEHEVETLLASR